jgi:hypothetical protein
MKESEDSKKLQEQEITGDLFLSDIWKMIEEGQVAQMPGNDLKSEIILRIQSYSIDIPLMHGQVSGLFLILCDLMIEGGLGRMLPDTFKVYLVILVMRYRSDNNREDFDPLALRKFTGIADLSRLNMAVSQLKEDGLIEHPGNDSEVKNSKKRKQQIFEVEPHSI